MPKHILFLIHGMGTNNSPQALDEVVDKLKALSLQYKHFRTHKLDDQVEFVKITYDNLIHQALTRWQTDATAVNQMIRTDGDDNGLWREELLGWLENANETERNFIWTHIADVLIYRLWKEYRNLIRIHVVDKVAEKVIRTLDAHSKADCSILAHSLGTAVTHDSLHELGSRQFGGSFNSIGPTHWRFQNIIMLANVGRILQTTTKVYDSIVRPGPNLDPGSYCYNYLNFRHVWDPIPYPKPFDPIGWPAAFQNERVDHLREINVHGYLHYLDNPKVHIPILRSVTSFWSIPDKEKELALKAYPQYGGQFVDIDKVRDFDRKSRAFLSRLGENPTLAHYLQTLPEHSGAVA